MGYPKKLYKTVNSLEEEKSAREDGLIGENEESKTEFPKMLYLHPKDKTQEHTYLVVLTEEEMKAAVDKGYETKPHIPLTEDDFTQPEQPAVLETEHSENV